MTNTSPLRLLIGLVLVVVTVSGVSAARLPEWAKPIAESAPAPPEGIAEYPSKMLFSETRVQVLAGGELRIRRRIASQALSPRAAEIGTGYFHLDEETTMMRSKAWHLPPAGRAKKGGGNPVDIALDPSFLTDKLTRFITVQGIEKGSLVFFEFEARRVPHQLAYQHWFNEYVPADLMRFRLETPPGWSVNYGWLRLPGPQPQIDADGHLWEVRDLPAIEPEPLSESVVDTAPLLVVTFSPPEGTELEPARFADWSEMSAWYERLRGQRAAATPQITTQAETLFAESGPEFIERVQAAAEYVRDQVRYVAKEVGIGGYQPHQAGEVLDNLYGDCKDKGTLFEALLAAAGLVAHPILINATHPDTVSADLPNINAFNHYVVGVEVPEEAVVPSTYEHALVDAGQLGQLLVVDTTSELTSVGFIPLGLQGKTGLVVTGEQSRLLELPDGPPSAHRVELKLDLAVQDNLAVVLSLKRVRYGAMATAYRQSFRASEKEYREWIEQDLEERWPGCTISQLSFVEETAEGGFQETLEIIRDAPRDTVGESLALFPMALFDFPRLNLGRRKSGVLYPHAMHFRYDTTVTGLAEHVATPLAKEQSGEGWSSSSEFSREGELLQAHWELEVSRLRYSTDELRDLKKLWSAARRTSSSAVSWSK